MSAREEGVIVAIDAHYDDDAATAGLAGVGSPEAAAPLFERATRRPGPPAPYASGALFLRELPVLEAALRALPVPVETIIVDGFVELGGGRPGLGAHLRRALTERPLAPGGRPEAPPAVIGVAKRPFEGAEPVLEITRGDSARPLYVSAAGRPLDAAGALVRRLAGPHRLPELLRRADHLARGLDAPSDALEDRFVYKIVDRGVWSGLDPDAAWLGSPLDARDGFIHLSRRAQLAGTLARHFAGRDDLLIVSLDLAAHPDLPIRWEPSRGGALFPHLYGPLRPGWAHRALPTIRGPDGDPRPPEALA